MFSLLRGTLVTELLFNVQDMLKNIPSLNLVLW